MFQKSSYIFLDIKSKKITSFANCVWSDGLHLTPDGNRVVYEEVVRVFNGAWLSAPEMPSDFPHHSEIDPLNPETAFQQRCL